MLYPAMAVPLWQMSKYQDPCQDPPTTLYLVSAEKGGGRYWKVGITSKNDPLERDPKHYKEVFRNEKIQWCADAENIEINVARTFFWVMFKSELEGHALTKPPAREGLSYDFPVEVPMEIFDWWLGLATESGQVPNPDYDLALNNAKYILTDCRYPNGFMTAFHFCWLQMKNGAGFDFESFVYKNHPSLDRETLGNAFNWMYESNSPAGARIGTLSDYREYAAHYYGLVDFYIPQLQNLLRFRPEERPVLPRRLPAAMWS